ncbi:MAG: Leucine aminopeptidase 1 [Cyphobasidiales sp. Tagirdzhanova-0007]|nr:MAG: Leucine aminopeptidase 1 [Cyphobasidiales sp. Tagirdzhanova-0007]
MLLAVPLLLLAIPSSLQAIPLDRQLPFPANSVRPTRPTLLDIAATLPSDQHAALVSHIQSLPERRIIALSPDHSIDISEGEKALFTLAGIRFIDITETASLASDTAFSPVAAPDNTGRQPLPIKFTYGKETLEHDYYRHIDTHRMRTWLEKFTSFKTRYYRSETGKQSQRWLLNTVSSIALAKKSLNMTVREFPHPWGQNSIIATLPIGSRDGKKSKGKVIIGAHQDSTNLLPFLSAPGADDDGSGTITVLEVLHTLVNVSFVPTSYDIEFHFYSAEEGGMLGSNAIASDYLTRYRAGNENGIRGMLQMDMTAYVKPGTSERIGVIQDFVDPELTGWINGLIGEYCDIPSVSTKCGYACSDHSAWTRIGVPSAFAIEATFADSNTGHIHSSGDTIDVPGFSFDHMKQFVKLATAFVLELAE